MSPSPENVRLTESPIDVKPSLPLGEKPCSDQCKEIFSSIRCLIEPIMAQRNLDYAGLVFEGPRAIDLVFKEKLTKVTPKPQKEISYCHPLGRDRKTGQLYAFGGQDFKKIFLVDDQTITCPEEPDAYSIYWGGKEPYFAYERFDSSKDLIQPLGQFFKVNGKPHQIKHFFYMNSLHDVYGFINHENDKLDEDTLLILRNIKRALDHARGVKSTEAEIGCLRELVDTEKGVTIDRAREILGKDFLGVEAVKGLENLFKKVGKNVEFVLGQLPPIPYTWEDLMVAKRMNEMLVIRPKEMVIEGERVGLSITYLIDLLKDIKGERAFFGSEPEPSLVYVLPYNDSHDPNFSWKNIKNQLGTLKLNITPQGTNPEWGLVSKNGVYYHGASYVYEFNGSWSQYNLKYINDSVSNYKRTLEQRGAKKTEIRRRTPTEMLWDTILYYAKTGNNLLYNKFDLSDEYLVPKSTTLPSGHYHYHLLVAVGYRYSNKNPFDRGFFVRLVSDQYHLTTYDVVCPTR